jgi:hypothetical protein
MPIYLEKAHATSGRRQRDGSTSIDFLLEKQQTETLSFLVLRPRGNSTERSS